MCQFLHVNVLFFTPSTGKSDSIYNVENIITPTFGRDLTLQI